MSTEKMREDFEAWCDDHFVFGGFELNRSPDGNYSDVDILLSWQTWQASRAAIEVELPEGSSLFMRMYGVGFDRPLLIERDKAVKAIELLGLKVKP